MKKIKRARCIAYILLILISIAMLFPFFWMVRSAFMTGTIWKIFYKFGDYCID